MTRKEQLPNQKDGFINSLYHKPCTGFVLGKLMMVVGIYFKGPLFVPSEICVR